MGQLTQMAGQRSLAKGVTLTAIVKTPRTRDQGSSGHYDLYQLVYQYGIEAFIKELASTSVKGLIIPDLPNEHAGYASTLLDGVILFLYPWLLTGRTPKRLDPQQKFIHAVAINGVTGKMGNYRDDLIKHLATLRDLATIPVLTDLGSPPKKTFNA